MVIEIPKNEIKEVIRAQIKEEFREAMEKKRESDYQIILNGQLLHQNPVPSLP